MSHELNIFNLIPSRVHNHEGEKYRLITKLPLIGSYFLLRLIFKNRDIYLGDISSSLVIQTDDQPKHFIYSVDSWLLETNSIELKHSSTSINSTRIEWTVYTRRRSILFQVQNKNNLFFFLEIM